MATVTLASYTLRVKKRGSPGYLRPSNFQAGCDILPIFESFAKTLMDERDINPDAKRIIGARRIEKEGRFLHGLIETGEFGFSSEFVDTETLKIVYQRSIKDAELLPFFFLAHIPTDRDEGLLILQRFGTRGIRKILLNQFQKYFRQNFPEHLFEINHLAPEQLFRQYLRGDARVTKLRFVRFGLPRDIADQDVFRGHQEEIATVEFVVSVKRNKALRIMGAIQAWFDGRQEIQRLLEFTGFDYDLIKCELRLNGRPRTFELSADRKFRALYDITNRVERGIDGHPLYDDLKRVSQEWLDSLLSTLYGDTI
jgi:hypothetical protein